MGSDFRDHVVAIHAHLEATATLPIDHRANRWLGEAEAVAADAVALLDAADSVESVPFEVLDTRLSQIRILLDEVEDTGSDEANDHVRLASRRTDEALARL